MALVFDTTKNYSEQKRMLGKCIGKNDNCVRPGKSKNFLLDKAVILHNLGNPNMTHNLINIVIETSCSS
jgi:hypothetical protein